MSRSFFFDIPDCAESFHRITDIRVDSLFTPGQTTNKPTTRVSTTLTLKKRKEKREKKNGRKGRCAALWIKHRLLSINCRKQTGNIELQCNSWYTLTASKQWNICRLLSPDLLCVDWDIYLSMSASSPKTVGDCYFLNFHSEHRANDHPCLRSWQKMTESL